MDISLRQFQTSDRLNFSGDLHPEELDLDVGIMSFPSALKLNGEARKNDDDLTVAAHLRGTKHFVCSRCLKEFNNVFEKDITLHYDIKGLTSVNIDKDIREELISDHPINAICNDGCKGLCPHCGADLNSGQCGCLEKSG